jgi:hypothetical protein
VAAESIHPSAGACRPPGKVGNFGVITLLYRQYPNIWDNVNS